MTNLSNENPIKFFSPKETKKEVNKLNNKKALGFNKITPCILNEMPQKGLTYLFNAVIRLSYWPKPLKSAEIILVSKQARTQMTSPSTDPSVSCLPSLNSLKKLLIHRLNPLLDTISDYQFGFCYQHSTTKLCHRVVQTLENRQYCKTVFLDVSQVSGKVWHEGLLNKIKHLLPSYFKLFKSYLFEREFRTKVNGKISEN